MKSNRLTRLAMLTVLTIAAYLPVSSFANTTVYQHCDYKGYSANLPVGDYDLNDLRARGIRNDDLSAIKVSPGYEITVYQHHHFGGRALKFRANDSCLVNNGFNDVISSIKVRRISPPGKATVYQHCDYKGYRVNLPPGKYDLKDLNRLGIRNDDLSAIRVSPGYEVLVYQHHHFGGRVLKFTANDPCLVDNGFNDIISSIKVRRISPPGKATVYQHCDYKGYRVNLPPGNYDLKDLNRLGIKNDDLSSIRIAPGYEIVVYEHHHFGGRVFRFRQNRRCLVDNNFNDTISSIRVRPARGAEPDSRVKVYQHCNYAGYVAKLKPGRYNLSALKSLGVRNDDLSALRIPAGFEAIVYEHDNFRGRSLRLRRSDDCLVNNGFNDIISSIIVRRL